MINWLIGSSGGGKSYEAVRYHILAALEKGRHVITNLPVLVDQFEAVNPDFGKLLHVVKRPKPILGKFEIIEDTPQFILFENDDQAFESEKEARTVRTMVDGRPSWQRRVEPPSNRAFAGVWDYYFTDAMRNSKGQGPLFVIDEAHFAMPRGATDVQVEEWYSTHRHFNTDVLLITQSYGKVSKAICDNTQLVYRVRKATAFGTNDRYIRKVQDGFRGEVVNTSVREYEPAYFKLYKSHTQGVSVEEFKADDVTPLWFRWPFIGAGLCFLTLILMLVFMDIKNPLDARQVVGKRSAVLESSTVETKPLTKEQAQALVREASQKPQAFSVKAPEGKQQAVPAQTVKQKAADPLAEKGIHIVGHLVGSKREIWIFTLSQNGQKLQELYDDDLKKIGYQIEALDDCGAWLTYKEERRFITCDSPQVSVSPQGVT
jgi:zona occludens toxin